MEAENFIHNSPNQIKVGVGVFITQEDDDTFLAYCPALELSTYGESVEDVKTAFEDVLHIFITSTVEKGTLERELLSLGWTLKKKPEPRYKPPLLTNKIKQLLSSGASPIEEQLILPV